MEELVRRYQLTKDKEILEKIINNSKDLIDTLINYYVNYNLSKEEAYDYAIEGLIYAANHYKFIGKTFLEYANVCITRVFFKLQRGTKYSSRLFEKFLEVKDMMEKKHHTSLNNSPWLLDTILEEMDDLELLKPFDYDMAKDIIIRNLETYSIQKNSIEHITSDPDLDYIKRLLHVALTKTEYDILVSYFGILGNPKETLMQIASRYNLTYQAIALIKENALKKVAKILAIYNKRETYYFDIDKVIAIFQKLLTKEEIEYLTNLLGLFGKEKKTLEELASTYHTSNNTITLKVGMAFEKISFLVNHLNLVTINTFNNIYQLFKDNLTEEEFTLFLNYYNLFGNSKENIKDLKKSDLDNLNKKIKLLITNNNILEFLRGILNKNEIEVFETNYLYKQTNQKTNKDIKRVFEMIITKLNIIYEFKDYKIDKVNILNFLKDILSFNDFNSLAMRFGLLNHSRYNKGLETLYQVTLSDRKLLEQIAIFLNFENRNNKSL